MADTITRAEVMDSSIRIHVYTIFCWSICGGIAGDVGDAARFDHASKSEQKPFIIAIFLRFLKRDLEIAAGIVQVMELLVYI